uniref:DNA-3-methyladenine glycosylase n=1 Tax=Sarcophilus harrisii TaxID=9305 RepID=G3WA01_SARHA
TWVLFCYLPTLACLGREGQLPGWLSFLEQCCGKNHGYQSQRPARVSPSWIPWGITHLPHPGVLLQSIVSISLTRKATVPGWDLSFLTSLQSPWPRPFLDRWTLLPLCVLGSQNFDYQHSILVRRLPDGTELRGRVVETEAYLGAEDEAAHSRGGRQTPRNKGMFMKPGTLYVYIIYGMYFCMNVSSQGEGACILLRSLEPVEGLEMMRQLRNAHRKGAARALKDRELCNGPSKLCQALAIDKSFDQRDLAEEESIWLEQGPEKPGEHTVVTATRIGINYAGEWALKPLRFYIRGNPYVSVVDRKVEQEMQASG